MLNSVDGGTSHCGYFILTGSPHSCQNTPKNDCSWLARVTVQVDFSTWLLQFVKPGGPCRIIHDSSLGICYNSSYVWPAFKLFPCFHCDMCRLWSGTVRTGLPSAVPTLLVIKSPNTLAFALSWPHNLKSDWIRLSNRRTDPNSPVAPIHTWAFSMTIRNPILFCYGWPHLYELFWSCVTHCWLHRV